jgi:hypothetical protein
LQKVFNNKEKIWFCGLCIANSGLSWQNIKKLNNLIWQRYVKNNRFQQAEKLCSGSYQHF